MENETIYPLANKWAFYMSHITNGKSKRKNKIAFVDFSKKLLKLAKFDTLNDFIKLINYMPNTSELKNGTYYVFKDNIQPAWEDEKNKGGEITEVFYCNKKVALTDNVRQNFNDIWHAILFAVVGGSFTMIEDRINGLVCKIRDDFLKVEFWFGKRANGTETKQKTGGKNKGQDSPESDLMALLDSIIPFPLFDISTSPIPSGDKPKDEASNHGPASPGTGSSRVGGNNSNSSGGSHQSHSSHRSGTSGGSSFGHGSYGARRDGRK